MSTRRPGLVAKKIAVQGKLGKRHMRTYWIRPHREEAREKQAQLLRLKEAQSKEKNEPLDDKHHAKVKRLRRFLEGHEKGPEETKKQEKPAKKPPVEEEDDWLAPAPKKAEVKKAEAKPVEDDDDWLSPAPKGPKTAEESKREVVSFFASRGLKDLEKQVNVDEMMKMFQKPDGSPMSAEDFGEVFKHPGRVRMPLVEVMGERETWGVKKTRPKLNEDGTPQYEDLDTTISFKKVENRMGAFTFEMVVMGQRLHPETGKPDGEPVELTAALDRSFNRKLPDDYDDEATEGLHVHHDMFVLKPEYSGGGLGMKIIKNQFAGYPKLGVTDVTVASMQMGSYVWGRMGFEATDEYKKSANDKFWQHVEKLQDGPKALLKGPNLPYTADELADMHDLKAHGTTAVFGLSVPTYDPATGKVENRQLWKDFMLASPPMDGRPIGGGLSGRMQLKPGDKNYEHMKKYLKIPTEVRA